MPTMEIKTETPPLVLNCSEPTVVDAPAVMTVKFESIFSLKPETSADTPSGANASSRSSSESGKTSPVENSDDSEQEGTAPRKSYSLRKRTVQCYDYNVNFDETSGSDSESESEPTSPKVRKQKQIAKSMPPKETILSRPAQTTIQAPVGVLTCDICSTAFFDAESLEDHVIEIHVVDKEFKCSKCSKRFISKERLDDHKPDHRKPVEKTRLSACPICLRPALSQGYLERHLLTHDAVRPLKCKYCEKTFIQKRELEIHQMNHHGKEKKFQCPKCPKSFSRNCLLTDHLRTHSEAKTIPCEYCGTLFKTKQSVKQHRKFCRYVKPKGDRVQANSVTKASKQEEIVTSVLNVAEDALYKKHRCSICSKIFSCAGNLKSHMVTHTEGRNFKCDVCNDTFKRRIDLSNHVLCLHQKTKAFKCTKCDKSYGISSFLRRHMALHCKKEQGKDY